MKITTTNASYALNILGNGPKNIIAFHGVGQDSNIFENVTKQHSDFKIYAIDLPFHGKTTVTKADECLSPEEIVTLVQNLVDRFGIAKFTLLGFSIGAKLIFPLIPAFKSHIQQVWLLAPDGVRINIWYRIATGTQLSRYVFRQSLSRPHLLVGFGNTLKSMRLIDQWTLKFVFNSTSSKEKIMQVYNVWIHLRKLKINMNAVIKAFNTTKIPLHIILGEQDSMITRRTVKPLQNVPQAKITMLPCRHHKLIEKFAESDMKEFYE